MLEKKVLWLVLLIGFSVSAQIKGEVVDENNQPIDFQILRSLGFGCDEEAMLLVKAYPWQRGSDPELTLDVSFVR